MAQQGRIARGIDIRTVHVTQHRSNKIVEEIKKLKNIAPPDSEPLTEPDRVVRELARSNRDFIIRNDPKIIALYLILDDMIEYPEYDYIKGDLIDIERFYTSSKETTRALDEFFWEKRPENITVARVRLWDAFQAYDKKLISSS